MSKKTGKAPNEHGATKWEQGLINASLYEGSWRVFIAMVVENKPDDSVNVTSLISAVSAGTRRRFTIISLQSLLKEVTVYGNPKGRGKDSPQYAEVCEACKVFVDSREPIPLDLLAKLIKFKLLAMKADDLNKGKGTEKSTRKNSVVNVDSKKQKSGKGSKSAGKKANVARSTDDNNIKTGTQMRRRSEEQFDYKYIDDEPEFGPNFYVILVGLYEPTLPFLLSEIDVNIDMIIKFTSPHYNSISLDATTKDAFIRKDSRAIAQEEAAAIEFERLRKLTEIFWQEFTTLLTDQPLTSLTRNIYVVDFSIDKDAPFDAEVYERFAHVLYDLVEKQRMHRTFLRNTRIIPVPACHNMQVRVTSPVSASPPIGLQSCRPSSTSGTSPVGSEVVDMRYYEDLMDTIPMECTTVPLILQAMIEQVVAVESQKAPPRSFQAPPTNDGLHQELAKHLASMLHKLVLDESFMDPFTNEKIEEPDVQLENPMQLINFNDCNSKLLHHLTPHHDFVPISVGEQRMKNFCFCSNEHFPVAPAQRDLIKSEAREFLLYCSHGNVSQPVVKSILSQYVFEHMVLNEVDEEGNMYRLKPSKINIWDHPILLFEQRIFPRHEGRFLNNSNLKTSTARYSAVVENMTSPPEVKLKRRHSAIEAFELDIMAQKCSDMRDVCKEEMAKLMKKQQRNLDDWNCMEHLTSPVFQQMLFETFYYQPHFNKYYHIREDCVYLMLYNPFNSNFFNKQTWDIQLHSNIGFRNFMLHVVDSIKEWSLEEDAKELALMREEKILEQQGVTTDFLKLEKVENKPSSTDDKKSKKKELVIPVIYSENSNSVFDENGQLIRPHSLKAMKRDELLLKIEDLDRDKKKRIKSPPGFDKVQEKKNHPGGRMGRYPRRFDDSFLGFNRGASIEEEEDGTGGLAFYGYQLDDNLPKLSSTCYTMFPCNGSQIRVCAEKFLSGPKYVRCSVLQHGHVFSVHLLNPQEKWIECKKLHGQQPSDVSNNNPTESDKSSSSSEVNQQSNTESEVFTKTFSEFGSLTAVLADGIVLSYSQFGPTGYIKDFKGIIETGEKLDEGEDSEYLSTESIFQEKPVQRKTKFNMDQYLPADVIIDGARRCGTESKAQFGQFPALYVTCPDGLRLDYNYQHLASIDENMLMLRLSYPYSRKGVQACEIIRNEHCMLEERRTILPNGTVIKRMKNSKFQVLHADGTVAQGEFPADIVSVHPLEKNEPVDIHTVLLACEVEDLNVHMMRWTVIQSNGQKLIIHPGGKKEFLPKVLFCMKSDVKSGQTMMTRDDNVILISEPNGKTTVEHQDGTRITSYFEKVYAPESHENITMAMFAMVECPSYATVKFNIKTQENHTMLGNGSMVNVFPNGYFRLYFGKSPMYEVIKIGLNGCTMYSTSHSQATLMRDDIQLENSFFFKHNSETICELTDSNGTAFFIDYNGEKEVVKSLDAPLKVDYTNHSPRFFILHRDGCVDELLNRQSVNEFLDDMEAMPLTIVLKDVFQDKSGRTGVTYLKPIQKTISDKWTVHYESKSIIPQGFLENAEISSSEKLHETKIVKCPKLLETRQFTLFEKFDDVIRSRMHQEFYNYLYCKFERYFQIENLKVHDIRDQKEKCRAQSIEDYVKKLPFQHLQHGMVNAEVKKMYENAMNQNFPNAEEESFVDVNEKDEKEKSRSYCHDENIRKALRNKTIPNYFESVFGKAFLANQTEQFVDLGMKNQNLLGLGLSVPEDRNSELARNEDYAEVKSLPDVLGVEHHSDSSLQNSVELLPVTQNVTTKETSKFAGEDSSSKEESPQEKLPQRHHVPAPLGGLPDISQSKGKVSLPGLGLNTSLRRMLSFQDKLNRPATQGAPAVETPPSTLQKKLVLHPKEVQFGTVRVDQLYTLPFYVQNTGTDSCRFLIKKPPQNTFITPSYKIGPIAAGLKRKVDILLYIPVTLGVNRDDGVNIRYNLNVITEKEVLQLPITARVLNQAEDVQSTVSNLT